MAIAAGGGNLYQLHDSGTIWHYTGLPCSAGSCPGWQQVDNSPLAAEVAGSDGELYQLRGDLVYQLRGDGTIRRYTGPPCTDDSCPGWLTLDTNPATTAIAAVRKQLFQIHFEDGSIWRHTGVPCSGRSCPGWEMLPCSGTSCPGREMLDQHLQGVPIVAGDRLFKLNNDGSIWRYTGTPCSGGSCPGWEMLDNNAATTAVTAAGKQLFQLHNDGSIWRYTGTQCNGTSCPGWERLDANPQAASINAGNHLFQLHNDGSLWRYSGTPCSGDSCPGWTRLDANLGVQTVKLMREVRSPRINSDQSNGFFTSVSSNGMLPGTTIIWTVSRPAGDANVMLYAFDASNGRQLFSAVAGSWPHSDAAANIVPTVANGRVYVATNRELAIFGLGSPAPISVQAEIAAARAEALRAAAAENSQISGRSDDSRRLKINQHQSIARIPWKPGLPIRTEQDEADWQAGRRERILSAQRHRRARLRRIDYADVAPEAAAIIDGLRSHRVGRDLSSILNTIVVEWAAFRNKIALSGAHPARPRRARSGP